MGYNEDNTNDTWQASCHFAGSKMKMHSRSATRAVIMPADVAIAQRLCIEFKVAPLGGGQRRWQRWMGREEMGDGIGVCTIECSRTWYHKKYIFLLLTGVNC